LFALCDDRAHDTGQDVVVFVGANADELSGEEVVGMGRKLLAQRPEAITGGHASSARP
jgi:hypothetical protein